LFIKFLDYFNQIHLIMPDWFFLNFIVKILLLFFKIYFLEKKIISKMKDNESQKYKNEKNIIILDKYKVKLL